MSNEPAWLSDEEQRIWLDLMLLMTRLPSALEGALRRESGLTLYEYLLLAGMSMAPQERLRLRDLADFTGTTLSRLSNVISKLEARGWVHRVPDPSDRRSTYAALTPEGRDLVVRTAPCHVSSVRQLVFDPLSAAQLRQLGVAVRRILDVVDPDGRDPQDLVRGTPRGHRDGGQEGSGEQ